MTQAKNSNPRLPMTPPMTQTGTGGIDAQLDAVRDFADTLTSLGTKAFRVRCEVFPVEPRGENKYGNDPNELIEANSANTKLSLSVTYSPLLSEGASR